MVFFAAVLEFLVVYPVFQVGVPAVTPVVARVVPALVAGVSDADLSSFRHRHLDAVIVAVESAMTAVNRNSVALPPLVAHP